MTSLTFTSLGGCREVGRNAFLIESGDSNFLLDYGFEIQNSLVPITIPEKINGFFLSHAHIDHSGLIPVLYKSGYNGKTFLTEATSSLAEMLLKDSIKVQERRGEQPRFLTPHIRKFIKNGFIAKYNQKIRLHNGIAEFYDAGHIPGSCQTLLDTNGKRVLYTGDIKFEETEMLHGADTRIKNVDVLISENTYSYKDHPKRREVADKLKEIIQETVYNNGVAVVASFAVGRAQELLLLLYNLGFDVYMDGMSVEATKRILLNPSSVKNPKQLKKAFGRVRKPRSSQERSRIIKKPCVIITTAGMLQGGPVEHYIKKLHNRPECSLTLTGYQAVNTVGRTLLDTGRYVTEGINEKLKMNVNFMDFSGHCGRGNLIKYYEKLNPKKILLVHGEHSEKFAQELKGKGFDTIAPKNGEKISL
ncbi:MAG: MBL fold metallo-hydrolase [Nanoarchaeota archaeon]|nr:MBL fold metallo-hydrolase [Nanoarchaeota archaeon]MBU1135651.1 MBL fold metallo-hydrolase [Nanoarchaeota archaeon]MBU2520016.1 MBL fold metallo-hydrolase [Nanoarchaeota archaeon]